jgi:hypothetical protein
MRSHTRMRGGSCRSRVTEMKGRYFWAALALPLVGVFAFLLTSAQRPDPIPRAALGPRNTESSSIVAGATPRSFTGIGGAKLSRLEMTRTTKEVKPNPFGPPRWAPRPAEEWQGMLINLNITPPCSSTGDCGLARACIEQKCQPCARDEHCAAGEACVLQHCISQELVECRHTVECGKDAKCILSGYSSEPRGNEGTRSYCNSNFSGGQMVTLEPLPKRSSFVPLPTDRLIEEARPAAAAK